MVGSHRIAELPTDKFAKQKRKSNQAYWFRLRMQFLAKTLTYIYIYIYIYKVDCYYKFYFYFFMFGNEMNYIYKLELLAKDLVSKNKKL